jgi:hypothetical protein
MVGLPKFSLVASANVVPEIVEDSSHTVSLRVFYHDDTSLMSSPGSHSQCYYVRPVNLIKRRGVY